MQVMLVHAMLCYASCINFRGICLALAACLRRWPGFSSNSATNRQTERRNVTAVRAAPGKALRIRSESSDCRCGAGFLCTQEARERKAKQINLLLLLACSARAGQ